MVAGKAVLGIPPHWAGAIVRVDDDGGVRAVEHRGSVRVVQEVAGRVARMPLADHQRRRARPRQCNFPVQRGILLAHGQILIGQVQVVSQPAPRPIQPARLSADQVDRAVGPLVEEPGDRDGRVTVERRQPRQRAVETIVGASVDGGAAVIDKVTVGVHAWVSAHPVVAVRPSQSLFQRGLVYRVFKRRKLIGSVVAVIGRIVETRRVDGAWPRWREIVPTTCHVGVGTAG